MRIILPSLLIMVTLAACSTSRLPAPPETGPLTLGESEKRYTLRDDLRPLAGYLQIIPVGNNKLIISDNSSSIYLFRNHKMRRTIGSEGPGSCQYNIIWSIDRMGDTLYVQSIRRSKIISYNIRNGICLGETGSPSFSNAYQFARGHGNFILGRMSVAGSLPDSTTILYTLSDQGQIEPLSLKLESLDVVDTPQGASIPRLNMARSGDLLYSHFPLTDLMNVMNLRTGFMRKFPLQIDIKRQEIEEAGENIDQLREVLNGSMESVLGIHASDSWISVYVSRGTSENGNLSRSVQFYHPDGTFRGEVEVERRPIAAHDNQLLFLYWSQDPDSKYTYELSYRPIISGSQN